MRPSRRPTVTYRKLGMGRASIVAWLPQNSTTRRPPNSLPNTDILRGNDCPPPIGMGPGLLSGSSVRPSFFFSPTRVFALAPPRCPGPGPGPGAQFSRQFPPARLYASACSRRPGCFFWPGCITAPRQSTPSAPSARQACVHPVHPQVHPPPAPPPPPPRRTGLCFGEPRAEVFTCIRAQLALRRGVRKTWAWVTATTSSARLCRRPNAPDKLAEVSSALPDVIIGRRAQMAASLVLLSRGQKFSYQGGPDCKTPCPGPEGAAFVP